MKGDVDLKRPANDTSRKQAWLFNLVMEIPPWSEKRTECRTIQNKTIKYLRKCWAVNYKNCNRFYPALARDKEESLTKRWLEKASKLVLEIQIRAHLIFVLSPEIRMDKTEAQKEANNLASQYLNFDILSSRMYTLPKKSLKWFQGLQHRTWWTW